MTALSLERLTPFAGSAPARGTYPIKANVRIFKGALVGLDSAGRAMPANTIANGCLRIVGKASATYDNRTGSTLGGAAGAVDVEVEFGVFQFANSSSTDAIAAANVGDVCYAVDDQTVALTSNGDLRPPAGIITEVVSSKPYVFMGPHVAAILALSGSGSGAGASVHSVRGATTANIPDLSAVTVAGIDGLTYSAGQRLLVKDQSTPSQNRIYVCGTVTAGVAPFTPALDSDESEEVIPGMLVYVSEGTVGGNSWFFLSTDAPIVAGTTNLTFVEVPSYADLASTAASLGANLVGYQDAGAFTAADDVDEALDEIYQGLLSIQKTIPIPLTSAIDIATGALLAVFAGGASTTPGTQLTDSKTAAVRWNNDAAPGAIAVNVPMPQDLDDTAVVTFHALVSKTGATLADATSLTVGAFEHIPGALHDADVDFGGATNAVTGDAAAKTVTELIRTFAAADIHGAPSSIAMTIKPTAGTLGTDDLVLHAAWLEYKAKLLTT